MQRKNNILKSSRNGIAMIMAITVILIVATIMALSLAMTAQTTKRTTDLYIYEQAVLLSKSATEYALLQIANNLPCTDLNTSFTQNDYYTIDIGISYIYYDEPATGINEAQIPCTANGGTLFTTVQTPEQNGSVIMDVTVTVDDENITSETIRYFRRSVQKL